MRFRYTAFDTTGKRVRGYLESVSARTAAQELERKGLTPIQVDEQATPQKKTGVRIPVRKLSMTYQQIADLLRAGVPLLRALRIVGRQKSSPRVAAVFDQLADEVADGVELSTAMSSRSGTFATSHVALIRAGEKAGILESVLMRPVVDACGAGGASGEGARESDLSECARGGGRDHSCGDLYGVRAAVQGRCLRGLRGTCPR